MSSPIRSPRTAATLFGRGRNGLPHPRPPKPTITNCPGAACAAISGAANSSQRVRSAVRSADCTSHQARTMRCSLLTSQSPGIGLSTVAPTRLP